MGRRGETVSYTTHSFEETYSKKLDAIKVQIKDIIYNPFVVGPEYACKKCSCRLRLHTQEGGWYCLACAMHPGGPSPRWSKETRAQIVEIMAGYADEQKCYSEWEARYVPPQEPRMPKAPEDQERVEFGKRLKEARKARGLTIEQLASQIRKVNGASMSFSSIQMYESGATYPPDHILKQLVKILGDQILEKKEAQEAVAQ